MRSSPNIYDVRNLGSVNPLELGGLAKKKKARNNYLHAKEIKGMIE
jgi:hypothetical protein